MTIQVKMQYFKSFFVPASLYDTKIYVSRPKTDVFAQFTGELEEGAVDGVVGGPRVGKERQLPHNVLKIVPST